MDGKPAISTSSVQSTLPASALRKNTTMGAVNGDDAEGNQEKAGDQILYSPMLCAQQTRLFVLFADWTEIAADDLEVGVLSDIVLRHLEHA